MPNKLNFRKLFKNHNKYLVTISVAAGVMFALLNAWLVTKELFILPIATLTVAGLYFFIFRLKTLVYLMAFLTPFSVLLNDADYNIGLSLPGEPIMIMVSLLFLMRLFFDIRWDKKVMFHPISIVIYLYLIWMFICCFTSELPLVSFKFLASKIWFITACYAVVIYAFKEHFKGVEIYFRCYAAALAVIVMITSVKHAFHGFNKDVGHWIMSPYYNDHTAYGAVLALFIPIVAAFLFKPGSSKLLKSFYALILTILLIGLYLSFSRAAWLSLVGMMGVWVVLKLRIKFSWIVATILFCGVLFWSFQTEIMHTLNKNSQDSSANISEQLQSMSNISTDASNVERLNRWVSAFGMVRERPVFGFGPGCYQFCYAPFQKPKYKTIITTSFGDGGNAHSEYFGPLAETGIVGMLTVILLLSVTLYYGIKTYITARDKNIKTMVLGVILGLTTYIIHGVLNNFLDTDKLSLPFWGCLALIVLSYFEVEKQKEG